MARFFPIFGDRRRRRIGLLGGSFNPAHDGHVHISREAMKRLGLDEVWWLVSPQNPLKPRRGMAQLSERLATARAKATPEHILAGDLESRLGTTRTAKVVRALAQRYPRISFVWLMGADNLEQFPRWWHWTQIFRTVRVAVLDRSPYAYPALAGAAATRFRARRTKATRAIFNSDVPRWSYLAIRRHGASGTAIRQVKTMTINRQETTITTSTTAADPKIAEDLEKKVTAILTSLDDDKGRDIMQFDLAGKTAMADRMIVATGTSTRQVAAMAEHLVKKLKSLGLYVRSEGQKQGDWVLVDSGDVVVHLFRPEVRAFYDIERLWAGANAKPIAPKPVVTTPAAPEPAAIPTPAVEEGKPAAKLKALPKAKTKPKPKAKPKAKPKLMPKAKTKKKAKAKAKPMLKTKAKPKAKAKAKAKAKKAPAKKAASPKRKTAKRKTAKAKRK